jgi:hypothetical protein
LEETCKKQASRVALLVVCFMLVSSMDCSSTLEEEECLHRLSLNNTPIHLRKQNSSTKISFIALLQFLLAFFSLLLSTFLTLV